MGRADSVGIQSVSDRNIEAVTWAFGLSTWVKGGTICSDGKHCGREGLGREGDIRATLFDCNAFEMPSRPPSGAGTVAL